MAVSGHKSESSIRQYSRYVTENKRRDMSHTLATAAATHTPKDQRLLDSSSPQKSYDEGVEIIVTVDLDEILKDLSNIDQPINPVRNTVINDLKSAGTVEQMENEPPTFQVLERKVEQRGPSSKHSVFNMKDCVANINYN